MKARLACLATLLLLVPAAPAHDLQQRALARKVIDDWFARDAGGSP